VDNVRLIQILLVRRIRWIRVLLYVAADGEYLSLDIGLVCTYYILFCKYRSMGSIYLTLQHILVRIIIRAKAVTSNNQCLYSRQTVFGKLLEPVIEIVLSNEVYRILCTVK
jgi:hypothetical protein